MTWQNELDELRKREAFAEELGGPERVKRQKDGGRYTIRERIALMADLNSFHETGKIGGLAEYDSDNNLKKLTPSNFVFGKAKVNGRPVIIGGDDFMGAIFLDLAVLSGQLGDTFIGFSTRVAEKHAVHHRVVDQYLG